MLNMRTYLIIIISLLLSLGAKAMTPVDPTTAPSIALVLYQPDEQGIYHKRVNYPVNAMERSATCYAYDKKSKRLYLSTQFGNYAIILNDAMAGQVKKDKNIPHLSGEELEAKVAAVNKTLDDKFERMNANRRQFLTDSIAEVKERERQAAIERERQAAIERARQDSIHQAQIAQHRAAHSWRYLPIPASRMTCDYCDKEFWVSDSVKIVSLHDGKVLYYRDDEGNLGIPYVQLHGGVVPSSWLDYAPYKLHVEAFADSIDATPRYDAEWVGQKNKELGQKFINAVVKKAPYGFFLDWDWEESYSMVTFDFSYLNTNKKTIKYIDVYWKITNDVDDVRKTGHFKGTGPVAQYETGRWSWDSSSYFVAGDATTMELTKVIITYMNGSQQTLSKKMIYTETDFHDE